MENRDSGRPLSLVVSSLIFTYHAAIAYLCTYLPIEPFYVSVSVTGYTWYSCALSLLGVIGSFKRSPILLTVFSNHLLIDTILSLIPKIGLLYLFHDLTSDLCIASLSTSFWMPTEKSSLHGPGQVMVPSKVNNSKQWSQAMAARRHCELGISIARVVLLAILVLWTSAQWGLGLYIRRYAVRLDINDKIARGEYYPDVEKTTYDDEKLAVDYQDVPRFAQRWAWSASEKGAVEIIEEKESF